MRKISAGGQHDQINYLRLAGLPPGEGIERRGEETVESRHKNTNSDERMGNWPVRGGNRDTRGEKMDWPWGIKKVSRMILSFPS